MRFVYHNLPSHRSVTSRVVVARDGELLIKARIKGHYRHLPNGRIVWIEQHVDKRQAARRDPAKYRGKVVHSDDTSTTVVAPNNELKKYPHDKHREMNQEDIHAHLGKNMPVDENLATKIAAHRHGVHDVNEWAEHAAKEEKKRGAEGRFSDKAGAKEWFRQNQVKPIHKKLKQDLGDAATHAHAYLKNQDVRDYYDAAKDNEDLPDHERAIAKMASEHSEGAVKSIEGEQKMVEEADRMLPKDCPRIPAISPEIQFFGHQAECLAKLDVLPKAIVDVDPGGGKGLLLPADAINLMAKGKVTKPLIVMPQATLDQNASKVVTEYTKGKVNVFKITNETINDQYGGDVEAMIKDIGDAPPNTLFFASYDVFAYAKRDEKTGEVVEGDDKLERGRMLSAAGFDYCALDESHNIKNIDSNRYVAIQYLTHIPIRRVASGTFVSNNPGDIVGQLAFLHPHTAMDMGEFQAKYGMQQGAGGVSWDPEKLKEMREELKKYGMISMRRSAWLHKLPKRNEKLSVVKMPKLMELANEAAVNDVCDQLEEEMRKNPKLRKIMDQDEWLDADFELPPAITGHLDLLGGITDYPDILAETLEGARKQMRDKKISPSEAAEMIGEGGVSTGDEELDAAVKLIGRLKPASRKAITALKGMVSPKAQDCYAKMKEHFKNKKNGKFIVFVQRKASAAHIMRHMPEELKKGAMYFDASQMDKLSSFTKDPDGPKIIVAVDASIKEGMNMQIANGMYRYDHHFSPGNQEQSYARVWRFGQDKDVDIHQGVADGGVDVTKYCRMMSKHYQNMQVTSDMPASGTVEAFKLSLDNIRNNRSAKIVPDYSKLGDEIMDFQTKENKDLRSHYGDKTLERATGKDIGGGKAEIKHGIGPYHTEYTGEEKAGKLKRREKDAVLGHFRDAIGKQFGRDKYDPEHYLLWLDEAMELASRHKLKGLKKLDPATTESYKKEYEHTMEEKIPPRHMAAMQDAIQGFLSGKQHQPHDQPGKADVHAAIKAQLDQMGWDAKDKDIEPAIKHVQQLLEHSKKNKIQFERTPSGRVNNAVDADKFFDKFRDEDDNDATTNYKKILTGAASILHKHGRGIEGFAEDLDLDNDDADSSMQMKRTKRRGQL